jgi:hypothetical protein
MDFYYKTNDWEKLTAKNPHTISIKGFNVPYAVFENEPEKTADPARLGEELHRVTGRLWTAK